MANHINRIYNNIRRNLLQFDKSNILIYNDKINNNTKNIICLNDVKHFIFRKLK